MNDLNGRPLAPRADPQQSVSNRVVDAQNPGGEFCAPTAEREEFCRAGCNGREKTNALTHLLFKTPGGSWKLPAETHRMKFHNYHHDWPQIPIFPRDFPRSAPQEQRILELKIEFAEKSKNHRHITEHKQRIT